MNKKPCSSETSGMSVGNAGSCRDNPGPEPCRSSLKKHPCPDCVACQFCSDTRCRTCLGKGPGRPPRMSIEEQIELYNKMNEGLLKE